MPLPAKTYGVLNPEQLARLFEMRADIAKRRIETAENQKHQFGYEIERSTWAEAAEIVRNTEFVGWTPSSRIVEELLLPATSASSEEGA